jgi:hypothetical protein
MFPGASQAGKIETQAASSSKTGNHDLQRLATRKLTPAL